MKTLVPLLLAAITLTGCGRQTDSPGPTASVPPPKIANLPARLTVKQRSTTVVPGSDGKLSVTVDDITAGQTMVSVLDAKQQPVMGPVSLSQGKSATFSFEGTEYLIELAQLDNALVGEDYVTLVISDPADNSDPAAGALTEQEKIERLINAVEGLEGATFVRNGGEHTPAEAAEHLRMKLASAGDQIATAEQFIEHLGSKSSITGDPYTIRRADGTEVAAESFLRDKLKELGPAR